MQAETIVVEAPDRESLKLVIPKIEADGPSDGTPVETSILRDFDKGTAEARYNVESSVTINGEALGAPEPESEAVEAPEPPKPAKS